MRVDPSLIIRTLLKNNGRVRQTARELGISPATVLNWRRRARSGNSSLRHMAVTVKRRSTRPKTLRTTSLPTDTQHMLLWSRREYGFGAQKLQALTGVPVHYSAIHRLLKAKGLTAPGKDYRRPRYQETTHMYLKNVNQPGKLQMDVKYVTPELSGLVHTAYLYAVIDIWSRWKQGVILPLLDQGLAVEALRTLQPYLPFQADFIQTDNGLEFQERFHAYTTSLGWQHHYIHKSSPNENAVIERSFRTDEEEFFWRIDAPPEDLFELNMLYQSYLQYYDEVRPHLGLGLKTPKQKLASFSNESVQ
ncbi:MAG TPA: integrase core domain-containing protein [Candidatus Saccharimonadales bacterium]|nr:integrase core domain-containing protein [Candidatus Saccharimonadales bacterium]